MRCERGPCRISPISPDALRAGGRDFSPDRVRIETERLALRVWDAGDLPAYFHIFNAPSTCRFLGRGPMTSDEAWTRLLRNIGHWALAGYGIFAVEEKASGRMVGEVGLGDFQRRLGPEFDSCPEARWIIADWAQGQGYATEAAQAALDWIESRFGAERTVCVIHSANRDSLGVARKLGYVPFAERSYRGHPAVLHERMA